ncbi:MAG: SOS response-associated peptidase [Azonexus sp.]|nr:SOS response-associated peptidase [Azonexus sp.]MDZ4314406.1 SOS response-associated peptidase [Azonexus sp.]
MCGCYELKAKARELNKQLPPLHLGQGDMPGSGEIHPTDPVLIITGGGNGYQSCKAHWGLVGHFLDHAPHSPLINLRSEGLAAKPFYSKILKRNRCLIPATAFYEWQSLGGSKQKIRISQLTGEPVMFAGIFDHHPRAGTTCAILTTTADAIVRPLHERMPFILGREECSFWLDDYPEFPDDEFETLLQTPTRSVLNIEVVMEEAPSPQLSLVFA